MKSKDGTKRAIAKGYTETVKEIWLVNNALYQTIIFGANDGSKVVSSDVKRLADVAYSDSQVEVRDGQEDGLNLDRFSLG